jgi:hypothetical protein
MKKINLILLSLLLIASCKKSSDEVVGDPADKFVKTYTVKEHAVQTYGGSQIKDETFTASIIKVSASAVIFKDGRTPVPNYSANGYTLYVNNDSIGLGLLSGRRYGNDSLVVNYDIAVSTTIGWRVKWVCK